MRKIWETKIRLIESGPSPVNPFPSQFKISFSIYLLVYGEFCCLVIGKFSDSVNLLLSKFCCLVTRVETSRYSRFDRYPRTLVLTNIFQNLEKRLGDLSFLLTIIVVLIVLSDALHQQVTGLNLSKGRPFYSPPFYDFFLRPAPKNEWMQPTVGSHNLGQEKHVFEQ